MTLRDGVATVDLQETREVFFLRQEDASIGA
jgi:hypothetical protein